MGPPNRRESERNAVGGRGCAATESWHGVEFCSAGSEGYYILGKTAPDISRRNKPPRGEPPRVGNVVQMKKKCLFRIFLTPPVEKPL
jgi:hypothetical protein